MRHTRYAKAYAGGRKTGMNQSEAAYALILESMVRAREIVSYGYETLTLKVSSQTRYTPDFFIVALDGTLELHEVKAGRLDKATGKIKAISEDASRIKLHAVAEKFPFRFRLAVVYRGAWTVEEV